MALVFSNPSSIFQLSHAKILNLGSPATKENVVIQVPDLPKFQPRPPFKGKAAQTWALIHGTSTTAARGILLEGLIRPADWTSNPDLKSSQLPTFGAYALGMEVGRADSTLWAAIDFMDGTSKKGKGQLPVLISALYKGAEAHLALAARGNDLAQIKIPHHGVVTTSEKHTLAHSRHTTVCIFAVTWDKLQTGTPSDSDNEETEPPPLGTTWATLTLMNQVSQIGEIDRPQGHLADRKLGSCFSRTFWTFHI
jgi:hypothetical protein